MIWPIDNENPKKIHLTQHFGENAEIYAQFGMKGHNGIDFRTRFMDSPLGRRYVDAALKGTVVEIGDQGRKGYGKYIRIEHEKASQTVYAHLHKFYVRKGQQVDEGERIGLTDNTGFSTGAHLHFGWRAPGWQRNYDNGFKGYSDPLPFLEGKKDTSVDMTDVSKWAEEGWLWARENHLCDTTKPKETVTAEWTMTQIKRSHDMLKSWFISHKK